MTLTQALSKLICRVLIGVFLLGQLAVAAYACPDRLADGGAATQAMSSMQGDCDQVDRDAPNLCVEHCRFGQQNADAASAPAVSAPVAVLLYSLSPAPQLLPALAQALPAFQPGLAAPPPPHTILHCVYRI